MVNYHTVTQEDSAGCGVACVATLLGISYSSALTLFDNPESVRAEGVYARDIVKVLSRSGVKASFKYVKPHIEKDINQYGTIVYIAKNKDYPIGHYLLRTLNGWMNPWINFPNIKEPVAGIVKTLPGSAQYAVFIKNN